MTTWTWECLLDQATGSGPTQDDVEQQAHDHNLAAQHGTPAISYGNDEPPPDPVPGQWSEVHNAQSGQLTASDWTVNPPSDCPQNVLDLLTTNKESWLRWRSALRALPVESAGVAPGDLYWPWPPPPDPFVAMPPPPSFVHFGVYVADIALPWEPSNPTAVMTRDGVSFGPYTDGAAAGGSLRYHGLDGQPFSAVSDLLYHASYDADSAVPAGSAPYARIYTKDAGGAGHDAIFTPGSQADPGLGQGPLQEWDASAGSWRWDDDAGSGGVPLSDLQAQYGDQPIQKIVITVGFTAGTNLRGLLTWEQINGQRYVFTGVPVVAPRAAKTTRSRSSAKKSSARRSG
jgi:hypothetical protein